jgi:arginase
MAIDSGAVDSRSVALVGARDLDPPEAAFIAEAGIRVGFDGVASLLRDTGSVYVALDVDVFDPDELTSWMPEPDGLSLDEVGALFARISAGADVVGAGVSGLLPDETSIPKLARLLSELGL